MANIQKRGDNSWLLTVYAGKDAGGKYIRRTKTVNCRNKKEAESEYAKFRQEVEAGEYIAPEKMTFFAFVEEWREKYGKKHLEAKTLETYTHLLKNHVMPVFRNSRIDQVKPMHIVSFIEKLEHDGNRRDGKTGGLAPSSIRFIHRVLKDIFARAVAWKIIKDNPVAAVNRPKIRQKEVEVYDEQEVAQLFEALVKEPLHWRIMITLALTTGLRRGELLGLEWKHIDLDKGTIDVTQSLSYTNGKNIVKEPKTKNSVRKISLPSSIIPSLKEYNLQAKKKRLQAAELWEGGDRFFVFSSSNGKPYFHTVPGTWFRRLIKRNGLKPIRFHDLRHTSATLLINQGVHAKTISARLGHADIRTTMNVYGHALQSADQAAADKFDSLLAFRKSKQLS